MFYFRITPPPPGRGVGSRVEYTEKAVRAVDHDAMRMMSKGRPGLSDPSPGFEGAISAKRAGLVAPVAQRHACSTKTKS